VNSGVSIITQGRRGGGKKCEFDTLDKAKKGRDGFTIPTRSSGEPEKPVKVWGGGGGKIDAS